MKINDNIKELMKAAKLNQKELAARSKITEASMSKYINGERVPRIDVIVKLAKALGVTVNVLLEDDGEGQSALMEATAALARCKDKLTGEEKSKLIKFLLED